MQNQLEQLSDKVLLCHCSPTEPCHGDVLIRAWEKRFLKAEEQESDDEAAQAEELFRAAELRKQVEEPESQSDDEPGQEPRALAGEALGNRCVWVVACTKGRYTTVQGSARQADGPSTKDSSHKHLCYKALENYLLKSFVSEQMSTDVFARLACGKVEACPFGSELEVLREQVYELFEKAGENPRRKQTDRPSLIEFRLLGAFLKQAGDAEKQVPDFADGVRVGVGFKLPRVPAVYPRKRKWSLKEQEDPEAHLWQEQTWGADNKNYSSAAELAEALEVQLELSVTKGHAFKLTEWEAREKYGDKLVVAALGAQVKSGTKEAGDLTIRLLFDGTHGVPVNKGTRVRG